MKLALHVTILAALLMVPASFAVAQEPPGKACKADREKLCPGIKAGDGKLAACMKEHEAEISAECKAARDASRDARKNVRANCKEDTKKFCATAQKDQGGAMKCLQSHASEVSEPCASALKAMPGANKS
jgi:hypothetical protein